MINEIEGYLGPEKPSMLDQLDMVVAHEGDENRTTNDQGIENELPILPLDVEWKKTISITRELSSQSKDEILSNAYSNISNRKTEATASYGTNTITRRDSVQDSFYSFGEEDGFQARQPWEIIKKSERASEPNAICNQNNVAISQGLFIKSVSQQEEIQVQIKVENISADLKGLRSSSGGQETVYSLNVLKNEIEDVKSNDCKLNAEKYLSRENEDNKISEESENQYELQNQQYQYQTGSSPPEIKQINSLQEEEPKESLQIIKSEIIGENLNQNKLQIEFNDDNNNIIQEINKDQDHESTKRNIDRTAIQDSFAQKKYQANEDIGVNKKQLQFLEDQRRSIHDEKSKVKTVAFRSESSGSSSDDPDIIKPVGGRFSVHIENDKTQFGLSNESKKQRKPFVEKFKQVSFMEIWQRVKTMDLSKEKQQLARTREKEHQKTQGVFNRLFTRCSPSTSILRQLPNLAIRQERDHILAFSSLAFNPADSMHMCVAKTIYCTLRNTDHCPHSGPHWLSIGFRYQSPNQIFEISQIFGALQILAFLFCYKEYLMDAITFIDQLERKNEEARSNVCPASCSHSRISSSNSNNPATQACCNQHTGEIKGPQKSINLCVILQDISKQVLVWLEKGDLNQFINIEKSAISVVNKIFFSTFFIFFERFKRENAGFLSISIAYKATIDWVSSNPAQALDLFKKQISFYYKNRD